MANTDALQLVIDAHPESSAGDFVIGEEADMLADKVDGEYRLLAKKGGVLWAKSPLLQGLQLRDFVCEVEGRVAQASGDGVWGLGLIRLTRPTHPWTGIMMNGLGSINTHSYDTNTFLPWVTSPALGHAASYHTLRVETRGPQIRVFLDRQFVLERTHERLIPCSLVIFLHGSQPGLDIRLRSIRVWRPK